MAKIKKTTLIDISRIIPNKYNPNEQTLEQLEQLVAEIDKDGFDHPLQVVPINTPKGADDSVEPITYEKGKSSKYFEIIGGEHRWKAATILSMSRIPCSVYNWSQEDQKLKTVRRNMLRGDLNDAKFTRLVQSIAEENDKEKDIIAKEMGFQDEDQFLRHIMEEEEKADEKLKESVSKEKDIDVVAIESVTDIVNNILIEAGDDIAHHFMFFSYGGKTHLMTIMDDELLQEVELAKKYVKENDKTMCNYMTELLRDERERRG